MNEFGELAQARYRQLAPIVRAKYDRYARQIVEEIKALGDENRTSGDESGLDTTWEEFKDQIQNGESVCFEAYEDTIRNMCLWLLKDLPKDELALLWVWCLDHSEEDPTEFDGTGVPDGGGALTDVEDELYSRVVEIAGNESLESDRHEEELLAQHNEDMALFLGEEE